MIWSAWAQAFLCWPLRDRGFVEPKLVALFAAVVWASSRRLPARVARPVLACYAALMVSWWFSISTQLSLYGLPVQPSYGLMALACLSVVFSYAHIMPVKPAAWSRLGCAIALLAIAQRLGLDPVTRARTAAGLPTLPMRATGWMGSPVDLGATLAMLLAFCGPLTGALTAVGLVLTGSRGAWIAGACGLLVRRWPRLTLPIMLASCLVIFLPGRNKDDQARVAIWRGGVRAFLVSPVIGNGPATAPYSFASRPAQDYADILGPGHRIGAYHNDILEVLAGTGILGLLAYLWFLGSLTWTPALVALFVNMKVNPMGIDVLAIAAVIAGSCL